LINNIFSDILLWINNNKGKFLGGLIGFIIGVFILTIGFFKTLFIFFCTTIGYLIGSKALTKEDIKKLLEKILPSGRRD